MNQCVIHGHPLGVFTGAPVGTKDPIISSGSLFLVDMLKSWPSSTPPVSGSVIGNVAWQQAATLIGSGTESTLAGELTNTGAPDEILFQMSGKGGLHGICSQLTMESTDNAYINAPQLIRDYIMSRLTLDEFYVSRWSRITRQATITNAETFQLSSASTPGSIYSIKFAENANIPTPGRGPVLSGGVEQLGNSFRNASRVTFNGTPPTTANSLALREIWGTQSSTWQNKANSHITYRLYVENLTVSGRSYATVDALDFALYTADVLTSGGRYYGDTFNDPATVLP